MYFIQRTEEFDDWLAKLKDLRAKAKIIARIRSAEFGNLGDVEPIGERLSEVSNSLRSRVQNLLQTKGKGPAVGPMRWHKELPEEGH